MTVMITTRSVFNVFKKSLRLFSSTAAATDQPLDPLQENALDERCFLVNEHDKVIGQASKRACHSVSADGLIPLHRAFSVFLFNTCGHLLLQQRSSLKITYPDCYTNTCCSHPIADISGEDEETDALGVKRAAQRRLHYELGIPLDQIKPEEMKYLTRIQYKDEGNGIWGENEIDYILIVQKDVTLRPNPNEVSAICYVPHGELRAFLPTLESPLTPWFNLIVKHRLDLWWDNLHNLDKFIDHNKIHKFC